jgi:hypothetical protein
MSNPTKDDTPRLLQATAVEPIPQNGSTTSKLSLLLSPYNFMHISGSLTHAGFNKNYVFIMSRHMKLKDKQIDISDISKDDEAALLKERECVYRHSKEDLSIDHIIPLKRGGFLADISSNNILCCKACNSSKLDKDIFEWY